MKITEIIGSDKRTLSFEVFPPKNSNNYESIRSAIDKIARLHPSYMSVTYGAGGSTAQYTAQIASNLKSKDVEPLAHLTCVHMNKDNIHSTLDDFMNRGIENILALRGDIPDGMDKSTLEYVESIISSPIVDLYMGKTKEGEELWQPVYVENGTYSYNTHHLSLRDFEITIKLPNRKTQSL